MTASRGQTARWASHGSVSGRHGPGDHSVGTDARREGNATLAHTPSDLPSRPARPRPWLRKCSTARRRGTPATTSTANGSSETCRRTSARPANSVSVRLLRWMCTPTPVPTLTATPAPTRARSRTTDGEGSATRAGDEPVGDLVPAGRADVVDVTQDDELVVRQPDVQDVGRRGRVAESVHGQDDGCFEALERGHGGEEGRAVREGLPVAVAAAEATGAAARWRWRRATS